MLIWTAMSKRAHSETNCQQMKEWPRMVAELKAGGYLEQRGVPKKGEASALERSLNLK